MQGNKKQVFCDVKTGLFVQVNTDYFPHQYNPLRPSNRNILCYI